MHLKDTLKLKLNLQTSGFQEGDTKNSLLLGLRNKFCIHMYISYHQLYTVLKFQSNILTLYYYIHIKINVSE